MVYIQSDIKGLKSSMVDVFTGCACAETRFVEAGEIRFAYREIGVESDVPLIMCNHLAGTIDDWDPELVDQIAQHRKVIIFDNAGVGGSAGVTPEEVWTMARDAIKFVDGLGHTQIDLLGFSLGGAVAQDIVFERPAMIRRLVLAGTGPGGGIGIERIPAQAYRNQLRSLLTFTDIRTFLFFTRTENGKREAGKFLRRLAARKEGRVKAFAIRAFLAQLKAISAYARRSEPDLSRITQPVLVANGEDDIMVPSINSAHLFLGLPDARLVLYKDAGHGGLFQYRSEFASEVVSFLSADLAE
ncbi:alpha/beta fold hydrolase [Parasphingorhabdus sp.]|jgi:pimeloyl-ACP methyl ester carboxylesterase|uniref:alpha/beta fold hydrolase n=1 Tax=Parasphingorhabdus sp. TaxID=2709688 RepID=UPI003D2BFA56